MNNYTKSKINKDQLSCLYDIRSGNKAGLFLQPLGGPTQGEHHSGTSYKASGLFLQPLGGPTPFRYKLQ